LEGVSIEHIDWDEKGVVDCILSSDIGIMPISESPWELGKCGYKLIQYMACGLPVIASNVGANTDIVRNEISGFLADDLSQWEYALKTLLKNESLRNRMGEEGRSLVENNFCYQVTSRKFIELLRKF
jgi:glycosyltransferase involved in cell wall biosynthesis